MTHIMLSVSPARLRIEAAGRRFQAQQAAARATRTPVDEWAERLARRRAAIEAKTAARARRDALYANVKPLMRDLNDLVADDAVFGPGADLPRGWRPRVVAIFLYALDEFDTTYDDIVSQTVRPSNTVDRHRRAAHAIAMRLCDDAHLSLTIVGKILKQSRFATAQFARRGREHRLARMQIQGQES